MMKKKHIYIYLLGMLLLSVGCTGKFREFNIDQSGTVSYTHLTLPTIA